MELVRHAATLDGARAPRNRTCWYAGMLPTHVATVMSSRKCGPMSGFLVMAQQYV